MSIDFSTLQGLTIPEGVVTQITDASGNVLWSANSHVSAAGEILDPWADISAGLYADCYSLGNWKSFNLTDGTSVVMEVVALNADTKTNGSKATITWISKRVITTTKMNSSMSVYNGWAASAGRSWLRGDFYTTIPTEIKNIIVPVNKTYYDYTTKSTLTCEDTVWIPSYREVFGNSSNSTSYETSGVDYTDFFTSFTVRRKYNASGSKSSWWLRSAVQTGGTNFRTVETTGSDSSTSAAREAGIVLGFCT